MACAGLYDVYNGKAIMCTRQLCMMCTMVRQLVCGGKAIMYGVYNGEAIRYDVYNDKAIMYDVYNGKAISVQW